VRQVALVRVLLHFGHDVPAAWQVIYASGSLAPISDSDLRVAATTRAGVSDAAGAAKSSAFFSFEPKQDWQFCGEATTSFRDRERRAFVVMYGRRIDARLRAIIPQLPTPRGLPSCQNIISTPASEKN
jgi:hypothetical protein